MHNCDISGGNTPLKLQCPSLKTAISGDYTIQCAVHCVHACANGDAGIYLPRQATDCACGCD